MHKTASPGLAGWRSGDSKGEPYETWLAAAGRRVSADDSSDSLTVRNLHDLSNESRLAGLTSASESAAAAAMGTVIGYQPPGFIIWR